MSVPSIHRACLLAGLLLGSSCGFGSPSLPDLKPLRMYQRAIPREARTRVTTALAEERAGVELSPEIEDIIRAIADAREHCEAFDLRVKGRLAKSDDAVLKAKAGAGIATGALTGVGGVGAGIASTTDNKQTTTGLALAAAGVGVIGALVVAFVEPGRNQRRQLEATLTDIDAELRQVDQILAEADRALSSQQVIRLRSVHLPRLKALCNADRSGPSK